MTIATALPAHAVPVSVELELTNKCQLRCTHCFNDSGPTVAHGSMRLDDWRKVVADSAELGVKVVQLIGGEPTAFPGWADLVDHALSLGLEVEVFSNLFHVTDKGWATFAKPGVRLATSYYSVNAGEHDKVTTVPGSHAKTRANIVRVVELGIPIRAGVIRCNDGQLEQLAVAELKALGVQRITLDDARGVGRASGGEAPTPDALCGNCAKGKLAVLPDGSVSPCVIGRWMKPFNIRQTSLRDILSSPEWMAVAASIPPRGRLGACPPDDSSDCSPASTPACLPSFFAPTGSGACPPNDSQDCSPANSSGCTPDY